jgi:hypothetical protein
VNLNPPSNLEIFDLLSFWPQLTSIGKNLSGGPDIKRIYKNCRKIKKLNSELFARNPVLLARPQTIVLYQILRHVSSSEFTRLEKLQEAEAQSKAKGDLKNLYFDKMRGNSPSKKYLDTSNKRLLFGIRPTGPFFLV